LKIRHGAIVDNVVTYVLCSSCNGALTIIHLFWHAPLPVRSAKRRHQSPSLHCMIPLRTIVVERV